MGLKESEIIFVGDLLEIHDGSLHAHLKEAKQWLKNYLEQKEKINLIIIPAWEGGHHDHDALHALAAICTDEIGLIEVVKQYPYYNGYKCKGPLFRFMKPIPENGNIEAKIISWENRFKYLNYSLSYPSQMTTWIGLFPFMFIHYLIFGTQILQKISLKRINQRPHSGPLYYERRNFYYYEKLIRDINSIYFNKTS